METPTSSLKCNNCTQDNFPSKLNLCNSGHVVCSKCSKRKCCPICKEKYRKNGWKELRTQVGTPLTPLSSNTYININDFRLIRCVAMIGPSGCSWSGLPDHLTLHLLEKHYFVENERRYGFVIDDFEEVKDYHRAVLVVRNDHNFLAKLYYDVTDDVFYGGVYLMSSDKDLAKQFRYEFVLGKSSVNNEGVSTFVSSRQTHAMSEDLPETSDQFRFSKDLGNFFKDTNGAVTVTVVVKDVELLVRRLKPPLTTFGVVPEQYCQRCVTML